MLGSTRELKGRLGTGQGNAHGIEMAMKGLNLDTHTSKSKKKQTEMYRGKRRSNQQQKNIGIIEWLSGLGLKGP